MHAGFATAIDLHQPPVPGRPYHVRNARGTTVPPPHRLEARMSVGEICNRDVVIAARDTTARAAATRMRHYHVGSLVVVDDFSGRRLHQGEAV